MKSNESLSIASLGLVCFALAAGAGENDLEGSFLDAIDRPLRVAIVSTGSEAFRQSFYELLIDADENGRIDAEGLSNFAHEADVLIHFLPEWSVANEMPGNQVFGQIFSEISGYSEEIPGAAIRVQVAQGANVSREMALFFFNAESLVAYPAACASADVVRALELGIESFSTGREGCL